MDLKIGFPPLKTTPHRLDSGAVRAAPIDHHPRFSNCFPLRAEQASCMSMKPPQNSDIRSGASNPSRREFAKLSLMALSAAGVSRIAGPLLAAESASKPNSRVAGVQLGINVPYSFGEPAMPGDEILKNCVQLGISAVELRTQPVEAFLGAPSKAGELPKWRTSVSLDRVEEFRKTYETAGVFIGIVKVDGIFNMSDGEIDYAFKLAKALGARAISSEISHKDDELKRVGQFADKHGMMVGYHGHATTKPADWERAFSLAKHNGANVDLGHFVAGNNTSPVPFLKQYHDRVTHVHLKDRKKNNGINMPFGEGDTPVAEVLKLMRDNKWNFQATIEFEYAVPAGSDRMKEIARALQYCKDALA